MDEEVISTIDTLSRIPGVSEKTAEGMYLLGIRSVEDLRGRNAEDIYAALRERDDFYAEPCMLNQLRIAIKMSEVDGR
jgi:Holliday junction resolvasome RuvABC DNA-binding subunit